MSTPRSYMVYVVTATGQIDYQPEAAWPRVMEDAADGFQDFPDIRELWFSEGPSAKGPGASTDDVLLWRRI